MDFMGDHMHCSACGDEFAENPAEGGPVGPSLIDDVLTVGIGDRVRVFALTWPEVLRVNKKSIVVDWPRRGPIRILPHRVTDVKRGSGE